MKNLLYLFVLVLGLSLVDCTSAKSQSKKDKKKNERCEEDVSRYRPKFDKKDTLAAASKDKDTKAPTTTTTAPAITNNAPQDNTAELQAKLDSMSVKNKEAKTGQGYRILVYSGKSTEEVKAARTKIYNEVPTADIYTDFKSPNQRVKVGNCIDRQEAYSLLGKLKKAFPNAVIIPDQIIIKAK